jgi:two-component system, OmpR family, sensor histidine kinase ChvG
MALVTERSEPKSRIHHLGRQAVRRVVSLLARTSNVIDKAIEWFFATHIGRVISGSLLRRILFANLFGICILILGILWVSFNQTWLYQAKVEGMETQGKMIAAAIASDARVQSNNQIRLDPDKLTDNIASQVPFRDDGFAALKLSIEPQRVTRILRRLIEPTKTRARIYSRDLTLVVDSSVLLTRGQLSRDLDTADQKSNERPDTKNFWTRLISWMIDKQLPVYKDIDTASGRTYREIRAALKGRTGSMLLLNEQREKIVSVIVPIRQMNSVQGVLMLSTNPGDIDRILWDESKVIWTPFLIALIATILSSFLLSRTVAEPMRRLSDAAERVSTSAGRPEDIPRFEDRVDEVGQMSDAFRAMTDALYRRIEASEKFAADVAHELKNPLAAARSTADALDYAKTDEQRRELVSQIQGELKRLNRLITDVSNTSRLDAELARQKMAPTDVAKVADSIVRIFKDLTQDDDRQVKLIVESSPLDNAYVISGEEGRLAQVLTNLVDNALSFSPEDGAVILRVKRDGSDVMIQVDDGGPGIPANKLESIFSRFYSDRPATDSTRGKNSGLGLSISREIVHSHRGTIVAENLYKSEGDEQPIGARFTVRIPAMFNKHRGGMTSGRRA